MRPQWELLLKGRNRNWVFKKMKYLLTLLILGNTIFHQQPTLKPNSIGVAYLEESNGDFYQLKVVFPSPRLQNAPEDLFNSFKNGNTIEFNFNGTLQFF